WHRQLGSSSAGPVAHVGGPRARSLHRETTAAPCASRRPNRSASLRCAFVAFGQAPGPLRRLMSTDAPAENYGMRRSLGEATRDVCPALGRPGYWLLVAGISGLYIACAKLGLGLSVAHGVITPVWAPSGISLAALVIFGRRFWPAVA